jgi:hypothetical protein
LKGILDKLKRRRVLHVVTAIFRQDEILSWVAQQNRNMDETFRLMIVRRIALDRIYPFNLHLRRYKFSLRMCVK